jgi:small-conductance mechanosensitive channel
MITLKTSGNHYGMTVAWYQAVNFDRGGLMRPTFITGHEFVVLFGMTSGGVLICWLWYFYVVKANRENVHEAISGAFIQNLTVILVVFAVGLLALAGVLSGELTATLLSGIVGYVLGSSQTRHAPLPNTISSHEPPAS